MSVVHESKTVLNTEKPTWLARLFFPQGTITLRREGPSKWVWSADKGGDRLLDAHATMATYFSNPPKYSYSPADGYPGVMIAERLMEMLKAQRAEYPPRPETDPNTLY